jgi:hypothetical protein
MTRGSNFLLIPMAKRAITIAAQNSIEWRASVLPKRQALAFLHRNRDGGEPSRNPNR